MTRASDRVKWTAKTYSASSAIGLAEVLPTVYSLVDNDETLCARSSTHSDMDSKNLQTASSYINNLLLSRGLLRNGTPIAFAEPAKAEGGVDATMAQVMTLVHDLILRRDVGP